MEPGLPRRSRLRRARKPARRRDEHDPGLAAEAIIGNLVLTRDEITAWYRLPLQQWSFRSEPGRQALITAQAARLTQLTGRRCHIRVTTRPFGSWQWAAALDDATRGRHPVMPGPCGRHQHRSEPGCPTCVPGHAWLDWLKDQQARVRQWGIADKEVYLGVQVSARSGLTRTLGQAWSRAATAEVTNLAGTVDDVTAAVAGAGLSAAPATPGDMQWLMQRSCSLHLPAPLPVAENPAPVPYALPGAAPAFVDRDGIAQWTDGVTWSTEPYGRTVLITRADGHAVHVAVLTVGSMTAQDIPQASPWIQRTDLLGCQAEWAVTFEPRRPGDVAREMRGKIDQIRHQVAHITEEHGQPAPPSLERQMEGARRIEDEAEHGPAGLAGRVFAWMRIAVGGETQKEALRRAGQVAHLYSPGVTIIQPPDQYRLAREFIPGEPLANTAHRRAMETTIFAAGMPAAAAAVGQRNGFPLGVTSSLSAGAVTWHPWDSMEIRNKSGLTVVLGTLGSGKTTLAGLTAYMAVRAGIATVILDPSGLLDRLCALPELAAHSAAVNLLHSLPGTLCPYRLIAEPRRGDYAFDDDGRRHDPDTAAGLHRQACEAAMVQRRELAKDVLRMLLPPETIDKLARNALDEAVRRAPATIDASPRDVITALKELADYGLGDDAPLIARTLEGLAEHPWARLFFPSAGAHGPAADVVEHGRLLTVMTLKGLVAPGENRPATDRTVEERLSVPIQHLAAWLTRRHVLDRPRHERKLTVLDEAHRLTLTPMGCTLVNEFARESRKNNHCAMLVSQLPQDLLVADVANLVGQTFAGRTEGEHEQAATLKLLGLPPGQGHEARLAALSQDTLTGHGAGPREFLFNDGEGGLEQIAVDLGGGPGLAAALNSTPTGRPAPAAAPGLSVPAPLSLSPAGTR